MENDWGTFADWAMKAVLGGICAYGVHVLGEVRKSIDRLNENVATVIETTKWHSKEIDRLDDRINRIEEKV